LSKLASFGVQNLSDVLQFQSNFLIQQDPNLGTGVTMQGVSGENIKILIDGVPVIGRQNGNIDFGQLNVLNVERIELVEGPLSVQYGTNALAGTINIITKKKPVKGIDFAVNSYYEAIGRLNIGSAFGWRGETASIMGSAGRNFFGGWTDNQLGDKTRFQDWKPKIQYFADVQYSQKVGQVNLRYAGSYFDEFILNRGKPLAPYGETAFDDNYTTNRLSNSLNLNYTTGNQFMTTLLLAYNHFERRKNTYYRDLVNRTQVLSLEAGSQDTSRFDLINARGTFARTGHQKLTYELGFDINSETGSGGRLSSNSLKMIRDYAAFVSAEWQITKGVTLRPGLRAAYNTVYQAPIIPSVHLRWQVSDIWTVRGSYGKGFRAPNLKELYFYFVDINHNIQGNENLKAETSHSLNTAITAKKADAQKTHRVLKFEASSFFNEIKNLITLGILRGGQNAYTYLNINQLQTFGGQFYAELVDKNYTIGVGGGLTKRKNYFNDQTYTNHTFDLRVNGSLTNIAKTGIDANLRFKYTGRQLGFALDEDSAVVPTQIEAFSMADAGLSRAFLKNKIHLALGLQNLFNVRSVQAQLAGGVHSGNGNGLANIATGRNFYTRLEIRF
jgi:outer membrane receptor for ferrienterochelin and colicins